MFVPRVNHVETPVVVDRPASPAEAASSSLVYITEQEVAFSTAAAVALPRTKHHWWTMAVLRELLHSSHEPQPVRHHYPPRRSQFLEQAAMSREMWRL